MRMFLLLLAALLSVGILALAVLFCANKLSKLR